MPDLLLVMAIFLPVTILSTEVFSLRKCISQALKKGYKKVLIKGDLKILIENIMESAALHSSLKL
jgi:hypothetical protein